MAAHVLASNVCVSVRIRPLENKDEPVTTTVAGSTVLLSPLRHHQHASSVPFEFARGRDVSFTFDRIFNSSSATTSSTNEEDIFAAVGQPCSQLAFQGVNSCIFAFGHTGSGKTYTMFGRHGSLTSPAAIEVRGIAPRMIDDIFKNISHRALQHEEPQLAPATPPRATSARHAGANSSSSSLRMTTTFVSIRIIEIYNEEVGCLLSRPAKKCLLRESRDGPFVDGAAFAAVYGADHANALIQEALALRKVSATSQNARSTRSHVVLTIKTVIKFFDPVDEKIQLLTSHMNLVDLAGSEKIGKNAAAAAASHGGGEASAAASGYIRYNAAFEEGVNINKSLLTLGVVIECLTQQQQHHHHHAAPIVPPYRDSKLTFLIKDALGGDSVTHMIATITPSQDCFFESYNTLQYADRAKKIRNHAIEHKVSDMHSKILEQQKSEIDLLRTQLRETCDLLTQQTSAVAGGAAGGYRGISLGDLFTPLSNKKPPRTSNNDPADEDEVAHSSAASVLGDVVVAESPCAVVPQSYLLLLNPCPIAETKFCAFLLPATAGSERRVVATSASREGSLSESSSIPLHTAQVPPGQHIELVSIAAEPMSEASSLEVPLVEYCTPRYKLVLLLGHSDHLRVEVDGVVVRQAGQPGVPVRQNATVLIQFAGSLLVMRLVRTQTPEERKSILATLRTGIGSPLNNNSRHLGGRGGFGSSPPSGFFSVSGSAESPSQRQQQTIPDSVVSPLSGSGRRRSATIRSVVIITPSRSQRSGEGGVSDTDTLQPLLLRSPSSASRRDDTNAGDGKAALSFYQRAASLLPPFSRLADGPSLPSRRETVRQISFLRALSESSLMQYGKANLGEVLRLVQRLVIYRGQWVLLFAKNISGSSSLSSVGAFAEPLRFTSAGIPILPFLASSMSSESGDEDVVDEELVESCVAVIGHRHERISSIVGKQFTDNDRADLPTDVSQMVLDQTQWHDNNHDDEEEAAVSRGLGDGPIVCRHGLEQYVCLVPATYAIVAFDAIPDTAEEERRPVMTLRTLDWNGNTTLSVLPCAAPATKTSSSGLHKDGQHDSCVEEELVVVEHEDDDLLCDVMSMNCALFQRNLGRRRSLLLKEEEQEDGLAYRSPSSKLNTNRSSTSYFDAQMVFLGRQAQQRTLLALIAAADERDALHDAVVDDLNTRIRYLLEDHSIMHFQMDKAELVASQRLETIRYLEEALARRDDAFASKAQELAAAVDLIDVKGRQVDELKNALAAALAANRKTLHDGDNSGMQPLPQALSTPPRASAARHSPNTSDSSIVSSAQHTTSPSQNRTNNKPRSKASQIEEALLEELDSRNRSVLAIQARFLETKGELESTRQALQVASTTIAQMQSEIEVMVQQHGERASEIERVVEQQRMALQRRDEEIEVLRQNTVSQAPPPAAPSSVSQHQAAPPAAQQQQQQQVPSAFLLKKELTLCRKELDQLKMQSAKKDASIVQLEAEVRKLKAERQK